MSQDLVYLVREEDLRLERIRKLGLALGTELWLRLGINWIWDCGGASAALLGCGESEFAERIWSNGKVSKSKTFCH